MSLPPHIFEEEMLCKFTTDATSQPKYPTTLVEIYVDDFIEITNFLKIAKLHHISIAMIHGVHSIFPPNSITGHCGPDLIS